MDKPKKKRRRPKKTSAGSSLLTFGEEAAEDAAGGSSTLKNKNKKRQAPAPSPSAEAAAPARAPTAVAPGEYSNERLRQLRDAQAAPAAAAAAAAAGGGDDTWLPPPQMPRPASLGAHSEEPEDDSIARSRLSQQESMVRQAREQRERLRAGGGGRAGAEEEFIALDGDAKEQARADADDSGNEEAEIFEDQRGHRVQMAGARSSRELRFAEMASAISGSDDDDDASGVALGSPGIGAGPRWGGDAVGMARAPAAAAAGAAATVRTAACSVDEMLGALGASGQRLRSVVENQSKQIASDAARLAARKEDERRLRLQLKAHESAFLLQQRIWLYVQSLVDMLDAKVGTIVECEQQALDLEEARGNALAERRVLDLRDLVSVATGADQASGEQEEEGEDEFGRSTTANTGSSAASARRKRVARRRQARRGAAKSQRERPSSGLLSARHHVDCEGWSTDGESEDEVERGAAELGTIVQAADALFSDVDAKLAHAGGVVHFFRDWAADSPETFTSAFVAVQLPQVLGHYARRELLRCDLRSEAPGKSAGLGWLRAAEEAGQPASVVDTLLQRALEPRVAHWLQFTLDVSSRRDTAAAQAWLAFLRGRLPAASFAQLRSSALARVTAGLAVIQLPPAAVDDAGAASAAQALYWQAVKLTVLAASWLSCGLLEPADNELLNPLLNVIGVHLLPHLRSPAAGTEAAWAAQLSPLVQQLPMAVVGPTISAVLRAEMTTNRHG